MEHIEAVIISENRPLIPKFAIVATRKNDTGRTQFDAAAAGTRMVTLAEANKAKTNRPFAGLPDDDEEFRPE